MEKYVLFSNKFIKIILWHLYPKQRNTNQSIYVLFKVSELDPLPKHICSECWTKIEDFHEFHEKIHAAQTNYLDRLVKYERENNFIDVLEPVNLNLDQPATETTDEFISMSPTQNDDTIKLEYETGKSEFASHFTCEETERTPDSEPLERNNRFDEDDHDIKSSAHTEDDKDDSGTKNCIKHSLQILFSIIQIEFFYRLRLFKRR